MISYIENPRDSTKKLLELIHEVNKVADTKLAYTNQLHFYMLKIKYLKKKFKKKQSHSQQHQIQSNTFKQI